MYDWMPFLHTHVHVLICTWQMYMYVNVCAHVYVHVHVYVQYGSVKSFRSVFMQRLYNDVYHSVFVPFPFLLHFMFSFTCLACAPFIAK